MTHDIGAWLEGLGLGRYADAFGENVIDPRPLLADKALFGRGVAGR